MGVDIKIKGLDEALKSIENMNPSIERELTSTLNDEGIEWRDDVRANTPVDSGELRRGMTFEGVQKHTGGFEMSLTNNLEYAGHVEFGHRTRGGKSMVKGRYMMKKGTIRLEERLPAELQKAMDRALGD